MSEPLQDSPGYQLPSGFMASLIEMATDAIFSEDLQGLITSWNRGAERLFGYSAAEILGQPVRLLAPPDLWDESEEITRRIVAGERIEHFDTIRLRKDGRLIDVSLTISPINNDSGQICGISKIAHKLLELKETRQQLQITQKRYHALFDSIDEGFCILQLLFDASGKAFDYEVLETNPAFIRQTGLRNAVGLKASQITPLLEDIWFERYATVAESGEPVRFESRVPDLKRWFNLYAFRFGEAVDHQVAVLFTDITARKEAEAERWLRTLAAERSKFEYLFSRSPAFVATLYGPQHTFDLINPAYLKMMGQRDLIGKPVREAVPDAEGQGFFELLDNVYRTGIPFTGEEVPLQVQPAPNAAPEMHYIDFVYQPIFETNGMVSGIFVHGVDVTEKVRVRQEVEAANQAKDSFLAQISCELRAPLETIIRCSDLMLEGVHPEEGLRNLEAIKASAQSQLKRIEDILKTPAA